MITPLEFQLAQILAVSPRGAGMDEMCRAVAGLAARRTVLRKLDELVRIGWVSRTAKARATRYHLADTGRRELLRPAPLAEAGRLSAPEESYADEPAKPPRSVDLTPNLTPHPHLGTEARATRDIIRQPTGMRKVCGYRREFLEAYEPGTSWYLSSELRERLRKAGQSEPMAAMPPGTYARHVFDRLLIDLSWNSSRLEGNTYSLLETDHLLAWGKLEDPARSIEAQMILNHKGAIEYLVENPSELGYNRYTLLNLHAILTEGLLKESEAEGALRTRPVGIGGSVFHPLNNPPVLEECFDLILRKVAAIPDPLEQCFFLMVHFPYLQPFEDGNKRTSRLAANIPLIQNNYSPISYVDLPVRDYADGILAVYELNRVDVLRDVFAWAYERSSWRYAAIRQEIGDPEPARARYREEIKGLVRDVVVRGLDKPTAAREIRRWAVQNVTASDRSYFIELVERQLLGLRESNIVRMKLRLSEYHDWQPVWQGRK